MFYVTSSKMQRVSRQVWVLQSGAARCVPGRVCLSVSATAGTSDKPRVSVSATAGTSDKPRVSVSATAGTSDKPRVSVSSTAGTSDKPRVSLSSTAGTSDKPRVSVSATAGTSDKPRVSVSATAGTSDKPRRKAKKHTTTATPEEQKCDYVGPPDSLSSLRHTRFYAPPDETSLERRYREARSDTQEWNQAFWASHNAKFKTVGVMCF
ncbi:Apoptogenic protein 1, mitochondrial [Chionoecetes opilio]|uniref:Apoptogenic protein 1, mitochondrial n=1 Tax=Chionoecetes opilio TaxID=41210 RepID=A0A8J5CP40_CHIOP|nr:Apoptogenic protein 1, mitochondrial [Chionoecetes opilio]